MANIYYDADGKEVKIGSDVRIRLSRLQCYGVDKADRHGKLISLGEMSGTTVVAIKLSNGQLRIVTKSDFRRDAPPRVVDADGKVVTPGAMARIRLSRMEEYDVDEDTRHGMVYAVEPDYAFVRIALPGIQTTVNVPSDDFRLD